MTIKSDVESANAAYAESFGDKADLALPPARGFLILTCMDARLDPAKYAGLAEGDAHVVRNAGGRATDDAIRSMVISHKLLGTREWFVIHHTDCGMLFFDDGLMGDLLAVLAREAGGDLERARPCRAHRAIGDAEVGGPEAHESRQPGLELGEPLRPLRREELEGDGGCAGCVVLGELHVRASILCVSCRGGSRRSAERATRRHPPRHLRGSASSVRAVSSQFNMVACIPC